MLPKKERISNGGRIKEILNRKELTFYSPLLHVIAKENEVNYSRLVVICTKKHGNAVVRNRIRRTFLEAYSRIRHKINKNIDLVIIPMVSRIETKMCHNELIKAIESLEI